MGELSSYELNYYTSYRNETITCDDELNGRRLPSVSHALSAVASAICAIWHMVF